MISGNRTSGGTRRNEGFARVEPSGATSAIATNQPSTSAITIQSHYHPDNQHEKRSLF